MFGWFRRRERTIPPGDDELSPEAIEAGAEVIWAAFDDVISYGSGSARETAAEVYRAMRHHLRARPPTPPQQS